MFQLHKDRIQSQKPLAKGPNGTLFPYQKNSDDQRWLIKLIETEGIDTILKLLPGISLGFSCDHPSILSNKGYCIEKNAEKNDYELYIKLPRAKESLEEFIKTRKESKNPFTEKDVLQHFCSLANGLEYLHKKKIIHNNLKPSNIMINDQGDIKIADVGIKSDDSLQGNYIAPELFGKKDLSSCHDQDLSKADMWSLGLILIEIALLESILIDPSLPREELESKMFELLKRVEENTKADTLVQLISPLVQYETSKRPTASELKVAIEKALRETQDLSSAAKIQQSFEVIEDQEENKRLNEFIEKELRQQKEQYEAKMASLLKEQSGVQEEKKKLEIAHFQLQEKIRIHEEGENQRCLKKFEEELRKISSPIFDVKMVDQDTLSIFIHGLPFKDYEQTFAGISTYSRAILEVWAESGLKGPIPSLEIDASNCSRTFTDLIMAGCIEGFAKTLQGLSFLNSFNGRSLYHFKKEKEE